MRSLVLLVGLTVAACGNLVDDQYEGEPLATFRGTLKAGDGLQLTPGHDLKVALVWESPQTQTRFRSGGAPGAIYPSVENTTVCTEQNAIGEFNCSAEPYEMVETCVYDRGPRAALTNVTDLSVTFPLDFSLALKVPPPPEALYNLADQGGQGYFAMANLIVFEDRDGDNEYDWGRVGVEPERIIAMSEHVDQLAARAPGQTSIYYRIAYLDGAFDLSNMLNDNIRQAAQATPQGFSIWENTVDTSDPVNIPPVRRAVLSIDRQMDLFAFAEIERTENGCETWQVSVTYTRDAVSHPEGLAAFQCNTDTEITLWPNAFRFENWVAPCEYDWGAVQRLCVSDLDTPPADWPCNP